MSLLIDHEQYNQLALIRQDIAIAAVNNRHVQLYQHIGRMQGFLQGLHVAGEIDAGDVASLEAETFTSLDFLLNARRAGNAN